MTTDQKQLLAIIVAAFFLLYSITCWFYGFSSGKKSVKCPVIEKTDTLWRTVTRYVDRPVEVIKWRDREKPVYIAVHDTTKINDTTYVVLPREVKQYGDSTYTAQVSGVEPNLDWIKFNQKTAIVTNTVEKQVPYKWTLSAFGEVGYFNGFEAKAGIKYDRQLFGPVRGFIQGGYSHRGAFAEGGIELLILKR